MHYFDDYLFIGKPDTNNCLVALQKRMVILEFFGIPLAEENTVFPCTRIEFLGIIIDSVKMEFCLPESKIIKIKFLLSKLLKSQKDHFKRASIAPRFTCFLLPCYT